jgi:hypothetical protein
MKKAVRRDGRWLLKDYALAVAILLLTDAFFRLM